MQLKWKFSLSNVQLDYTPLAPYHEKPCLQCAKSVCWIFDITLVNALSYTNLSFQTFNTFGAKPAWGN